MRPLSRPAQRVLLAVAALLLAVSVRALLTGPAAVSRAVADDPSLELRIDVNRGSVAELEALPGIGPALAGRIVAHRAEHGPFRSLEDLRRVRGVGEATLREIAPLVVVR